MRNDWVRPCTTGAPSEETGPVAIEGESALLRAAARQETGMAVAGASGVLLGGERVPHALGDLSPGLRAAGLEVGIRRVEEPLRVLPGERADRRRDEVRDRGRLAGPAEVPGGLAGESRRGADEGRCRHAADDRHP